VSEERANLHVITPLGHYISKPTTISEEALEDFKEFLKEVCSRGSYLEIELEEGGYLYLPKEMIQQSLFITNK
jgi:hypothetical protein